MTWTQRDGSEPEFSPLTVPKKPAPVFRAQTSWKPSKCTQGQSEIWDLDSLLSSAQGRSVCQPWEWDTCNLSLRVNPPAARHTWNSNEQPDCWDFLHEKGKRLHSLQGPDTSEIARLYPYPAHTSHLTACTQRVIFTCELLESALPSPGLLVGRSCNSQPSVLASTAHTPTTQELVLHLYNCFSHT